MRCWEPGPLPFCKLQLVAGVRVGVGVGLLSTPVHQHRAARISTPPRSKASSFKGACELLKPYPIPILLGAGHVLKVPL